MKHFQILIAGLLFFLSGVFISCQSLEHSNRPQPKSGSRTDPLKCIQQVIALDDSLGRIRNHACEHIPLSEAILAYTGALEKVDFSGCPEAFFIAIQRHRQAWREILPLTDRYSGLRGEMHNLFKQIEGGKDSSLYKSQVKKIWDTWDEVEQAMGSRETH